MSQLVESRIFRIPFLVAKVSIDTEFSSSNLLLILKTQENLK